MGNSRSTMCFSVNGRDSSRRHTESIVPDQDPLLRAASGRVHRCEIGRDFDIQQQVLGTGYSGAVVLAVSKSSGQQVAVKQFSKKWLKPHRLQLLQSEIEVYLRIDHPNICRLLHVYDGKDDVWLVMELCGCQLYNRLHEKKVYRESDAAQVMLQMLQALSYLHTRYIVHRDLKLENWMYGATDRDDKLKLIDFGFSRKLGGADETLHMPCGTLHYTSPEVLSRNYTSKCDIWSLGVICYMLLLGKPPFRGSNNFKLAKAITQNVFPKDNSRWNALSRDAQSFVEILLQKDASKRPDAMTALNHRWVTEAANLAAPSVDIGMDVLMNLQKFAYGSHLRKVALTMLAYSLTSRELQDMEETFLAFDKTGRGTISLDELAEVMQQHMEVSEQEVTRIFQSLNFANDEELHYTPFIAAMLATRVNLHEDKVRAAFDSFDCDGSGYITADSLISIFRDQPMEPSCPSSTKGRPCGLTRDEAERWVREVDYKGNGAIDYEGFLSALMGKRLCSLPLLDAESDAPAVKVFECESGRPRGLNESFVGNSPGNAFSPSRVRHNYTLWVADGENEERRSQSFSFQFFKDTTIEAKVQVRNLVCDVEEMYFN